jgi:hypothetical protein
MGVPSTGRLSRLCSSSASGRFFWPGITLAVLVLLYGGYLLIDGILAVLWALTRRREGALPWGVFLRAWRASPWAS